MGRIVFFTVGEDECRSWAIDKGMAAVEAAGVIHTDLSKGFIRAELMSYDDFLKAGYEEKNCKAAGTFRLESKEYVVQDGDIMHIRASV
jgi:ribosome-binding ATPase YchF (GTP1/OBG family)